jgi:hypothetical protein
MESDRCPSPEDWAVFAAGAASEAEWRRHVRHLAECATCRRQAGLLALSEGQSLPAARLPAPPPPLAPPRLSFPRLALRAAAAALILGALAYALRSMNHDPAPKDTTARNSPEIPPSSDPGRKAKPLPEWPEGLKPRPVPDVSPSPKREIFPPPPGLEREDPVPPPAPPPPDPGPAPAPPPAPAPAPSLFLARHAAAGVAEAVEIAPAAGRLTLDYDTTTEPLARATYIRPSQILRSREGGSFVLPDGATVHLAKDGQVAVAWSQTLLCYSVDVTRGEALVDLGAAPRSLHVGNGPLGVRLADSSGQILVSVEKETLRATPLSGPAEFRTPAGDGRTLRARETLVLRPDRDAIESLPDTILSQDFPTLEAAPARVPPRPDKPVVTGPSAAETVRALPAENYRYRVSGRLLREGAWFPQGVLYASIDDFSVVKRTEGGRTHARRGTRAWDDLGSVKPGSREDRLVGLLRNALAPHLQIETALAATRGEPGLRAEDLQGRACTLSQFAYDPAKIRPDVSTLIDQAVLEGRMDKPDHIYWDSLEGTIEVACSKGDSRVLRAVDRRRVSYSYNSVAGLLRRTYALETVYEFYDHGKASLKLPADILKEMDPSQK